MKQRQARLAKTSAVIAFHGMNWFSDGFAQRDSSNFQSEQSLHPSSSPAEAGRRRRGGHGDGTRGARQALAEEGHDPVYGARPLKRTIVSRLETPISRMLVGGELQGGDALVVDWTPDGFSYRRRETTAA